MEETTKASPAEMPTESKIQPAQKSQSNDGTSKLDTTIDEMLKILQPQGPDGPQTTTSFFTSGYFPRFKALEEENLKFLQEKLLRQSPPYNMQDLGDTLHQYSKCNLKKKKKKKGHQQILKHT